MPVTCLTRYSTQMIYGMYTSTIMRKKHIDQYLVVSMQDQTYHIKVRMDQSFDHFNGQRLWLPHNFVQETLASDPIPLELNFFVLISQ
jgi:hypothetical protein